MKKKVIFIFLFAVLTSCQKKTEIGIHDIQVPKYYKEYDDREFLESKAKSKGVKIIFSSANTKQKSLSWKDSKSKNFLHIGELLNGMLTLEKKERIQYLKEDGFKIKIMNQNYEVYEAKGKDTIFNEIQTTYATYFFIKKDSACFAVSYSTIDNDFKKLVDYKNIINTINDECVKGSIFKSSVKNQPKEKVIAN